MRKIIISFTLIVAMVISTSISLDTNNEVLAEPSVDTSYIAEHIEEITGLGDVNFDIEEDSNSFSVEGETSDIIIPVDGNEEIILDSDGCSPISIEFPDEMQNYEGEYAGEGTIVYDKEGADAFFAVQATRELQNGLVIEGVKNLVTIENEHAPKEYNFSYNLPDNYSLVRSEEYDDEYNEKGWIYIVDNNSKIFDDETGCEQLEIVALIEPAWAKDLNGNDIETYYKIKGNDLIQIVEFDENSAFPIVADPKTTSKPKSKKVDSGTTTVKIDLGELGGVGLFAGVAQSGLTKAAKMKIFKKIAAKISSRFIPVLGCVSLTTGAISYAAYKAGYRFLRIKIGFEKWTTYKHQGGRWVQGYRYLNCYLSSCKLKK